MNGRQAAATYPVHFRRGVHLPASGLWLDPTERRDLAVVSHAHGDHIARHRAVVCTEATLRILRHRLRTAVDARVLGYGEEARIGSVTVSLHPAGHVLGSAQVLVGDGDLRVLYSGDIRCRPGRTAEPLEHVECDLLVVESTFGHPRYRFPPSEEVVADVVAFCRRALADGCTPVLLAYALGKGQEVLAALRDSGLRILLHRSVHAIAQLYRELGVDLPEAGCIGGPATAEDEVDGAGLAGAVLVVPPHLRELRALTRLGPRRTALLSGWAVDGGASWRLRCDAAFPLSDHCDFDELLTYVERSRATRVLTLHGFADELAHQLRRRGIEASALRVPEQLPLALSG